MTHEEVEELVTRRLAEEMEAREAARTLEPLNENGDEQEGKNGGNGNGGNGGKGKGGNGENGNRNRNGNHGTEGVVELMKLMTEVYCPRNEIQKMETELWNLTVKGNDLIAYTQRLHHEGLFTMRYGNYKKVRHQTRDCRAAIAPNTQRAPVGNQ
ncbi:hypothetical protein Tco_0929501 [Tanacetum coccineum]